MRKGDSNPTSEDTAFAGVMNHSPKFPIILGGRTKLRHEALVPADCLRAQGGLAVGPDVVQDAVELGVVELDGDVRVGEHVHKRCCQFRGLLRADHPDHFPRRQ